MNAKDIQAIAGIINHNLPVSAPLDDSHQATKRVIEALADYFEKTESHTGACLDQESHEWVVSHEPFNRAAWIAACYGETAHQDHNATPERA